MKKNYMLVNYDNFGEKEFNVKEIILDTARQYGLLVHLRDKGVIEPKLENYLSDYTKEYYLENETELKQRLEKRQKELKTYNSYTVEEKTAILKDKLDELYKERKRYYEKQAIKLDKLEKFKQKFNQWICPEELNFIKQDIECAISTAEEDFSREYYSESTIKELENISPEEYHNSQIDYIINNIAFIKRQIKENKNNMEKDNRNEEIIKLFDSMKNIF